jgi:hypothetical protein
VVSVVFVDLQSGRLPRHSRASFNFSGIQSTQLCASVNGSGELSGDRNRDVGDTERFIAGNKCRCGTASLLSHVCFMATPRSLIRKDKGVNCFSQHVQEQNVSESQYTRSEKTPGSSTTNVWLVAEYVRNCPVAALLPHARGALCASGMTTD